ncbi:MAG: YkvA family protein [Pseudomonadales bacterium]
MQPEDAREIETQFWPKFRRVAARLPFAADLLAAYYAAIDPITPRHVRGILLGALGYFIMPADLIPDFILGLGFTDDAAVLAAALKTLTDHIQPAHQDRARKTLDSINTAGETQ